jgi:hypothetical protein
VCSISAWFWNYANSSFFPKANVVTRLPPTSECLGFKSQIIFPIRISAEIATSFWDPSLDFIVKIHVQRPAFLTHPFLGKMIVVPLNFGSTFGLVELITYNAGTGTKIFIPKKWLRLGNEIVEYKARTCEGKFRHPIHNSPRDSREE